MEKCGLKMELCKGRHGTPAKDGSIFENEIDPLNLDEMAKIVHSKLIKCTALKLYVTGLSVALVTVINYCCTNNIKLTLYHYDRESGNYYPQEVASDYWKPQLLEAGYVSAN